MHALSGDCNVSNIPSPIIKKIRDDILWHNSFIPFRRSGMWICIKFVLNIYFCHILKENGIEGKICYKLFMVDFMSFFIKKIDENYEHDHDHDLTIQMIAKIARRLHKLKNLLQTVKNQDLIKIYEEVKVRSFKIIKTVKEKLENQWEDIIVSSRKRNSKIDDSLLKFEDFQLKLTKFLPKWKSLKESFENSQKIIREPQNPPNFERNIGFINKKILPNLTLINENSRKNKGTALYDIELWLHNIDLEDFDNNYDYNAEFLLKLQQVYHSNACQYYKEDPIGKSRYILSSLHIIYILDKMLCKIYPLFIDHSPNISLSLFWLLSIVDRSGLKYMKMLYDYFNMREQNSKYPSLLSPFITNDTFSTRFYHKYVQLKILEKSIEDWRNKQVIVYRTKINNRKKEYESLMQNVNSVECEYWADGYNIKRHKMHCYKCNLRRKATDMTEEIFEEPLPENSLWKKAVLFELTVPKVIEVYRDALHFFLTEILNFPLKNKSHIETKWIKYENLNQFTEKTMRKITLGSTRHSFKKSHYKTLHVSNAIETFFVKNGLNVFLCDGSSSFEYNQIFSHQDFSFAINLESPYLPLNPFLISTTHNENEIITVQYKCPSNLDLMEFQKFGFSELDIVCN